MKKFLSLVLAVIMTMSLVTISASATEYKDFTDKDEIQYEEAVAVLNRLGIITGYSEGDFRPEGELTRGAAAKIIASLLLGPEAAENLSPTSAPFKDVPLDHAFAGPIAYCSTLKIINGYSDGSFQPGGTLTGYAFSKMLLGALGYKSDVEHFTGAGWNMNVSARGAEAGLFDRLNFKGNDAVNREQAAQLALNTIKGTMVEYKGGMTVTAGDASVVSPAERVYKTSNQDFARNISDDTAANNSEYYTVEFGEEHFVDLRLEHDKKHPTRNDLGQPSAEWSYKKVTIGTYPLEPDFRYTEQVIHCDSSSTDAARTRALGLNGYEVDEGTNLWLNGTQSNVDLTKVAQIATYTDPGTVVEVYVSETNADYITDVVVIQSALMEVKRIGSDYVALDKYDDNNGPDTNSERNGFNQDAFALGVENVQEEDDAYSVVSGLKVGDKVVIIPVAVDHGSTRYEAFRAYVPETVSGDLSRVDTYGNTSSARGTIGLTVGGTSYKTSQWNKKIIEISGDDIKVTTKDVTLTLDEYGNAMLAEDVGSTSEYMVVGSYYQSLVDGRLVTYAHGWDVSGNELDLNLGSDAAFDNTDKARIRPGDLVQYTNDGKHNTADWKLLDGSEANNPAKIFSVNYDDGTSHDYQIKTSNTRISLIGLINDEIDETITPITPAPAVGKPTSSGVAYYDKSVKFIYVTMEDGEVESVEIKNGVQNVSNAELKATVNGAATGTPGSADYQNGTYESAQAYVKGKDSKGDVAVKAVVIKQESNSAISTNLLYVTNYYGSDTKDSSGKIVHGYTVAMNSGDGLKETVVYAYDDLKIGDFASYSSLEHVDGIDSFYKLRQHNTHHSKTTTSLVANAIAVVNENQGLVKLANYKTPRKGTIYQDDGVTPANVQISVVDENAANGAQVGEMKDLVRVNRAEWFDMTGNSVQSAKDLNELIGRGTVEVALVVNDNPSNDGFRDVAMVVITDGPAPQGSTNVGTGTSLTFAVTNALVQYRFGSEGGWTDYNGGSIRVRSNERVEFMVSVVNSAVNTVADVHLDASTGIAKRGDIFTIPANSLSSGSHTVTVSYTAPAPTYALSAAASGWSVAGVTTPLHEGDTVTLTLTQTGTVAADTSKTLNTALTPTTDFTLTGTGIAAADCTVKVTKNAVKEVAEVKLECSTTAATFTAGAATESEWNTAVATSQDGKLYKRTGGTGTSGDPYTYEAVAKPDFASAPGNTVDLDATPLYPCTVEAVEHVAEEKAVVTIEFTMPANAVNITAFSLV